jgi:hypothetical protein
MIDWTKPIETVGGRAANLLTRSFWRNGETYCVVQVEDSSTGDSEVFIINPATARCIKSGMQIRNVKVKRVAWCLVSPKYCIINRLEYYRTEELAQKAAREHEVVARIEWEE